jgi:hypothetical protein
MKKLKTQNFFPTYGNVYKQKCLISSPFCRRDVTVICQNQKKTKNLNSSIEMTQRIFLFKMIAKLLMTLNIFLCLTLFIVFVFVVCFMKKEKSQLSFLMILFFSFNVSLF